MSLAWLVAKDDVVPIPKGRGTHLAENLRAADLVLDPEDVPLIDGIDPVRRIVDREKGPWRW